MTPGQGSRVPVLRRSRAAELLRAVKAAGLKPQSDAELLPLLLELIGGHIPVEAWPTQMPTKKRKDHAREVLQGEAAAADRPQPPQDSRAQQDGTVVPLHQRDGWRGRAQQANSAVDEERRRRQQAVPSKPDPPPPLSSRGRRHAPFALTQDDTPDGQEAE